MTDLLAELKAVAADRAKRTLPFGEVRPGDVLEGRAADEIERQRAYAMQLEAALSHAVACCSAFQNGGQFAHLSRLGESIFDAVPRLVAKLSN